MPEDAAYQVTVPGVTIYYVGLLVKGPAWTPESTPETRRLQAAHLTNNRRLVALGKLILVGPCLDDSYLRGVFVFRVDSLAEARALVATDPAIQAGRLACEIHPWMVPEGMLNENTVDMLATIDGAIAMDT